MRTLLLTLILIPVLAVSQNIGVGASAMYNFQSESWGAGARVNVFPNRTISYVPQFSYYFIGPVSEFTLGLSIEAKIKRGNTFNYYLMAHGGYNQWMNSGSSAMDGAQAANWNLEGGVGITTNHCLRPFLEYRYNVKFQETHLRLGLLYIFGCGGDGGGYRDPNRMRNHVICPAY
ncbi:MAG: hypothetical protein KDD41_01265 [Flavobacteriales bacterium]|nr:hypothetical protein [Flavobacteriales bacterium]